MQMSTELAYEDFLRKVSPVRVLLERPYVEPTVAAARAYQQDTELVAAALRTGDRVRLEAAVFSLGMAA